MKTTIGAAALGFSLVAFMMPVRAQAEGSSSEKAAAEALFREAVALIEQNQTAQACDKFAASQAIDPTLGTMLRLGDCYDRVGKTASAWAVFEQAAGVAREANQPDRERLASERGRELEGRLSKVILKLAGTVPPGLVVKLNEDVIHIASLGTALPVDPGPLNVTVSAPGYSGFEQRFEIAVGPSSADLDLPKLEPAPELKPEPTVGPAPADSGPRSSVSAPGSTQRTLAYVTGGVGLAGLIASGVLGYKAYDLKESSLDQCLSTNENACTSEGKALRDDARGFGNFATIAGVAGGALLAASVVLLVTAPPGEPERASSARAWVLPLVSTKEASLELGGRF